jgi:uncharacterized membrane protein YcaP (DUF421 family)
MAAMSIDWQNMLSPDVHPLEIVIRGSLMFLGIFVLLRVILKRQTGSVSMSDLLLITLLADASQNGMAGEYRSVTDGMLLVLTIIAWNFALDWLAFRFPVLERLIEPPPLELIRNGKLLRRNMRKEMITEAELITHAREQGLEDLSKIKSARIESDGQITVIQFNDS